MICTCGKPIAIDENVTKEEFIYFALQHIKFAVVPPDSIGVMISKAYRFKVNNRKFCLGKWGKSFYIHNYGGEINEELETFTDRQSVLLVINEIQNVTLEEAWEKVLQAAYK